MCVTDLWDSAPCTVTAWCVATALWSPACAAAGAELKLLHCVLWSCCCVPSAVNVGCWHGRDTPLVSSPYPEDNRVCPLRAVEAVDFISWKEKSCQAGFITEIKYTNLFLCVYVTFGHFSSSNLGSFTKETLHWKWMKGKQDSEEESALFRAPSRLKHELQMWFLCPKTWLCATPHFTAKFLLMAKYGLEKNWLQRLYLFKQRLCDSRILSPFICNKPPPPPPLWNMNFGVIHQEKERQSLDPLTSVEQSNLYLLSIWL